MQPGNGRYPVMFNQQKAAAKARARDEEEESGEDGDSEGSDDEKETKETTGNMKVGAPIPKQPEMGRDNDEEAPKVAAVNHMSKAERDAYYNTDELRSFSQEEDAAIKQQLDGQQLIQQTGPTLIKVVNTEIKNATPNWVSGKWVKNMKNAAKNA